MNRGQQQSINKGALRRQIILEFLKAYQASHGYMPSCREIGPAVGLHSAATVSHQLQLMEREGSISRERWLSRAIRITEKVPA